MVKFNFKPRSLIKINHSLLVTLPVDWCNNHKLAKHDLISIGLDEQGRLVLSPKREEDEAGKVE